MGDQVRQLIHLQAGDDSVHDLRGRQSVRTTFRLSPRTIRALSILAGQLGIRQKSLFDYLIDDIQALRIIAEQGGEPGPAEQRVAKTFVISRRTLENLEQVSTSYNTPRDVLVEVSIERIMPLISLEKEKHEYRKKYLDEMNALLVRSGDMLRRAEIELGPDDPVFRQMLAMVKVLGSCCTEVGECIRRGRKMEDFSHHP